MTIRHESVTGTENGLPTKGGDGLRRIYIYAGTKHTNPTIERNAKYAIAATAATGFRPEAATIGTAIAFLQTAYPTELA